MHYTKKRDAEAVQQDLDAEGPDTEEAGSAEAAAEPAQSEEQPASAPEAAERQPGAAAVLDALPDATFADGPTDQLEAVADATAALQAAVGAAGVQPPGPAASQGSAGACQLAPTGQHQHDGGSGSSGSSAQHGAGPAVGKDQATAAVTAPEAALHMPAVHRPDAATGVPAHPDSPGVPSQQQAGSTSLQPSAPGTGSPAGALPAAAAPTAALQPAGEPGQLQPAPAVEPTAGKSCLGGPPERVARSEEQRTTPHAHAEEPQAIAAARAALQAALGGPAAELPAAIDSTPVAATCSAAQPAGQCGAAHGAQLAVSSQPASLADRQQGLQRPSPAGASDWAALLAEAAAGLEQASLVASGSCSVAHGPSTGVGHALSICSALAQNTSWVLHSELRLRPASDMDIAARGCGRASSVCAGAGLGAASSWQAGLSAQAGSGLQHLPSTAWSGTLPGVGLLPAYGEVQHTSPIPAAAAAQQPRSRQAGSQQPAGALQQPAGGLQQPVRPTGCTRPQHQQLDLAVSMQATPGGPAPAEEMPAEAVKTQAPSHEVPAAKEQACPEQAPKPRGPCKPADAAAQGSAAEKRRLVLTKLTQLRRRSHAGRPAPKSRSQAASAEDDWQVGCPTACVMAACMHTRASPARICKRSGTAVHAAGGPGRGRACRCSPRWSWHARRAWPPTGPTWPR